MRKTIDHILEDPVRTIGAIITIALIIFTYFRDFKRPSDLSKELSYGFYSMTLYDLTEKNGKDLSISEEDKEMIMDLFDRNISADGFKNLLNNLENSENISDDPLYIAEILLCKEDYEAYLVIYDKYLTNKQ